MSLAFTVKDIMLKLLMKMSFFPADQVYLCAALNREWNEILGCIPDCYQQNQISLMEYHNAHQTY